MRNLSIRLEDELLRDVKLRALETGHSLTAVVQSLLEGYVANGALGERGRGAAEPDLSPRSASAAPSRNAEPEPPAESIVGRVFEKRRES